MASFVKTVVGPLGDTLAGVSKAVDALAYCNRVANRMPPDYRFTAWRS